MKNYQPFISRAIILIVLLLPAAILSQSLEEAPIFDRLSVEEGLSQVSVFCIAQDARGFMWFGTQDGLNRYDGYRFKIFRHVPNDQTSLSDNFITSLLVDGSGRLWIGTQGGVHRFNDDETFTHFAHNPEHAGSLSNDFVWDLHEDHKGNLWVGTDDGISLLPAGREDLDGFITFKHDSDEAESIPRTPVGALHRDGDGSIWFGSGGAGLFQASYADEKLFNIRQHTSIPGDSASLSNDIVWDLFEDERHTLWIATANGLNRFDRESDQFTQYIHNDGNVGSNNITRMLEDVSKEFIWLATSYGLKKFYPADGSFVSYRHDGSDPQSLGYNVVLSLFRDPSNFMWIGTSGAGINTFRLNRNRITHYRKEPNNPGFGLNSSFIFSIAEDNQNNLWAATVQGGVNKINKTTGRIGYIKVDPVDPAGLSFNNVRTVYFDEETNKIWIGTWGGGLDIFDPVDSTFVHFRASPTDSNTIPGNAIFAICRASSGEYWLGTAANGIARMVFDQDGEARFTRFRNDPADRNSLSRNAIFFIKEDSRQRLWIGTQGGGADLFDKEAETFTHFKYDPLDPKSIGSNRVRGMLEDSRGDLWFGTDNGLCRLISLDSGGSGFERYTVEDGLPNNVIYGIVEAADTSLWLSTNYGLSRFDPRSKTFKNYDVSDGLQSNEFNTGAYLRGSDGQLIFGGVNGINMFYPDSIRDNQFIPPIVITDFSIAGVPAREKLEYKNDMDQQVVLQYDENFISFEFSALNYHVPEKNQYAYMLEGVDEKWVYSGGRRYANYTNLEPGEYSFRVIGSNNNGIWNRRGLTIELIVLPPFWKTWWFQLFAILSTVASVLLIHKVRVRSIEKRNNELEAEVQRRTAALVEKNDELNLNKFKLEELNKDLRRTRDQALEASRIKSEFLANISHELRTPMNGIIGMTNLAIESRLTDEQQEYLSQALKSADSLMLIISEILNFNDFESGSATHEVVSFDMMELLNGLISANELRAQEKKLKLTLNTGPDVPGRVAGDRHNLKRILSNLFSNSIKFSHRGEIILSVNRLAEDKSLSNGKAQTRLCFSIQDSGIGIPADKLETVFEPFQQVDGSYTRKYGGTGLGLATARHMVENMGGRIWAESTEGLGSTFTFTAPFGDIAAPLPDVKKLRSEPTATAQPPKLHILVAEDNAVNQKLCVRLLEKNGHTVSVACNGREAVEAYERGAYDIILMDIQMPEMSGVEATQAIRARERITQQHIPIVAVTAHANSGDRERYLESGMDAYVSKPIERALLLERIYALVGEQVK